MSLAYYESIAPTKFDDRMSMYSSGNLIGGSSYISSKDSNLVPYQEDTSDMFTPIEKLGHRPYGGYEGFDGRGKLGPKASNIAPKKGKQIPIPGHGTDVELKNIAYKDHNSFKYQPVKPLPKGYVIKPKDLERGHVNNSQWGYKATKYGVHNTINMRPDMYDNGPKAAKPPIEAPKFVTFEEPAEHLLDVWFKSRRGYGTEEVPHDKVGNPEPQQQPSIINNTFGRGTNIYPSYLPITIPYGNYPGSGYNGQGPGAARINMNLST